jgi:hypothetical protein
MRYNLNLTLKYTKTNIFPGSAEVPASAKNYELII